MNKKQWIEKIDESKEWGSFSLNWTQPEWERYCEGNFTRDQKAMLKACEEKGVLPFPYELSPDTICFH